MTRRELEEVAALVTPLVLGRLTRALGAVDAPCYSSRKGHGPPGYPARTWQAIAKAIGVRRGRWWVVTPEALAAFEASRQPAKPAATPWSPETALEAMGLRIAGHERPRGGPS